MVDLIEGSLPPPGPDLNLAADWLSMAVRSAHVAVGVSSLADGRFVDANDAFCRLFQWPREDVIGRTAQALGLWPDETQHQRLLALVGQHGSVSGHESRYRNQRGEQGHLQISASIVQRDGAAYLVVFLTEVSAQYELLQGLQAAHARLAVALRASGVLVFRQDHALRYTWVANPALGSTEADLIGRTDEEIMGADAAEPLLAIKRRVLQTGQPERRDVWVGNKGQLGCFDLVVEPEFDAAGRVVAIVCAAQDITQRKAGGDAQGPRALAHLLHAILGMAALIGREQLSEWQSSRLQRITREAGRIGGDGTAAPMLAHDWPPEPVAGWALKQLRERHAGDLVLVAEQNVVLRELVAALLEQAGLRVVQAGTGVEAFSLAVQLVPALLLLDVELPQRGGAAAARALRAMLPRRLPIVAMVSADPPAGVAPALDADLDDVIEKPVAGDRLYEKVLAWLPV